MKVRAAILLGTLLGVAAAAQTPAARQPPDQAPPAEKPLSAPPATAQPPAPPAPQVPPATSEAPPPAEPPIRARSFQIQPWEGGAAELSARFTPEQIALLEKLNRRDVEHLPRAKTLAVPEDFALDELAYSPLPLAYPWAEAYPKAIVVDQPSQVFGAYEQGRLVRWGPISSGRREHPTPAGLFHLNWRSPARRSTDDPDWFMRWYFNFDNRRGLAFHQLELPGRAASHACVRLLERDARWLYDWGEGWVLDEQRWNVLQPGTPVLILGEYDFDAPPPWLAPDWLASGVELPAEPATGI
jgi:lipoprotein-anchoring transpeptidase ErfK/SrfK